MNMPKVIFRTVARNAQATIARAIESVLRQTYANWEMHLVNNGSEDNTGAIMEQYREKDSRIRVFTNEGNFVWGGGNRFTDYYKDYDAQTTYLCYLDGDDEYKPEFLEKMVPFARENNLDIAVCGYDTIHAEKNELIETSKMEEELFLEGEGFAQHFTDYYYYMRTRWAKLFKLTVTEKITVSDDFDMLYGGDTAESLEYFRCCRRAGFYPGALLNYYANPDSVSYRWVYDRIKSDRLLYDLAVKFLNEKAGSVSPLNEKYLASVYMAAISRTTRVLLLSDETTQKKFEGLFDIFTSAHTRKMAEFPIPAVHHKQREAFFSDTVGWIAAQPDLRSSAYYDKMADIMYVAKYIPESLPGWSEEEILSLFAVFSHKFEEFRGIV